ncbi:hypothetical protein KUCAC02_025037 [Chaenocephalus aceratus]|nr:hypothetical protein KUCAC02_025037 [Chaenocephalus aceratus]
MDSEVSGTMEVAALGQPFSLGMLYDCRKDSLVPGTVHCHSPHYVLRSGPDSQISPVRQVTITLSLC